MQSLEGGRSDEEGANSGTAPQVLGVKEQGTPTHTATGAVSKPLCRGDQAAQNLPTSPKREQDQIQQGRVIKFTCWTVDAT